MNPIPGRPPGPPHFSSHPGGPLGHPMPGPTGAAFAPPPPFHQPNWLPPGWTEHKAPDGMSYYYNAASGQSSWIRPTMALPAGAPGFAPPQPPPGVLQPMGPPMQQLPPGVPGYLVNQQPLYPPGVAPPPSTAPTTSNETGKGKKGKKVKKEKAVKKTQVLESPWFIVVTNLDNTFFFNKETKVSIWAPTSELEAVLAKMGQIETDRLEAEQKARYAEEQERLQMLKRPNDDSTNGQDVTEKRSRNETDAANAGTEMTEDDVAWQLAAMEDMMDADQDQDQHMQSQDEDDDDDDEDDEAVKERLRMIQGSSASLSQHSAPISASNLAILPDNIQEREMAFLDMMRDRGVTQFDTWEKAIAKIERDPRMYLIPDKKDRQELFESFCVIRAREIKEAKDKETKGKEAKDKGGERNKKDEDRHSRESKSHSTSSPSSSSHSSSKPEDVYRRLVEEFTTKTSTWLDFMTKYRVDPKFLGLKPGSLRESIFRQYLADLKKGLVKPKSSHSYSPEREKRSSSASRSSSSKKYKATQAEIDEFTSLLKETKKDILYEHKNSSSVEWRKIKKLIDRDRRYDAVGSSTEREQLFREYADRVIQRRD
ncbi:transcription elongation regulator [Dissophora globulifera]|uniref:Transcription elongation regulator n=1 Tax=Dissophora globulifera TaxID=979702 RepID=A0A9P6RW12_9FUNG|nr:transcription elongation regulator [Dissophora globulifera]